MDQNTRSQTEIPCMYSLFQRDFRIGIAHHPPFHRDDLQKSFVLKSNFSIVEPYDGALNGCKFK